MKLYQFQLITTLCLLSMQHSVGFIWSSSSSEVLCTVGSTAHFSCVTNLSLSLRWNFFKGGFNDRTRLYSGRFINPKFKDRHAVLFNVASGTSTLTIQRVRLSDGGKYTCLLNNSDSFEVPFSLVVVADENHGVTPVSEQVVISTDTEPGSTMEATISNPHQLIAMMAVAVISLLSIVALVVVVVLVRRRKAAHHVDNSSRYSRPGRQRHTGFDVAVLDSSNRYSDIYEDANTYESIDYQNIGSPDTEGYQWRQSSPSNNDDKSYETLNNRSLYTPLSMNRLVADDGSQTEARY